MKEGNIKKEPSGFIERWASTERKSAFLGITLYALIGFCALLLITVLKLSSRPQPIYYIPGAQEAGVAYPNRIDKTVICGFASSWLLNRNNFTPATAKDTYARAMRYMAPQLLAKTKAGLEGEMSRVERDGISSLFSLSKEPELQEENTGYKVTLTGEKVLFMGKEKLDSRVLRYTITLEKSAPVETNPYGLVIAVVKQEQLEVR